MSKKIILVLGFLITHLTSDAQLQQIKYSDLATFAIDFYNTQIGALSHFDTLYTTTDNGNTWVEKFQVNGQFTDIKYATPSIVFASALKATPWFYDRWVYKSINNGNVWDSVLVGTAMSNYQKIAIRSTNEIALFDSYSDTYKLSNFATHTTTTYLIQANCNIKNLRFFNDDTAIALLTELIDTSNYAGNIYLKKTTDGGNTWNTIWSLYNRMYATQADFYDYEHGIIRVDSAFYITNNAGANWSSMPANADMTKNDVLQMINADIAYTFHDSGLLRINLPMQAITDLALDSIEYMHDWIYADFLDDSNWFIAENILSCGIIGCNVWRQGTNENNPTSITTPENENNISVFPNPANDILTISIAKLNNQEGEIQLTDMQGKIIFQRKTKEATTQFNTSKIAAGQYLLKCSIGEHSYTNKIILQH